VAFGLGFPENVLNDPLFGYNTKRRFDYIIIDPESANAIEQSKNRDQKMYDYITRLLTDEYSQIYDHRSYTIYSRKPPQDPPAFRQSDR
jgi:hypothetical protein